MHRVRRIALVALAAVLVIALSGCGIIARKAVEETTGVKVDDKSGSVTIEGEGGKSATISGEEGKVPENMPSDVPVYDGDIESGGSIEAPEGVTYTYSLITKDDMAKVTDWYKQELTSNGFDMGAATVITTDESSMITAKKGNLEVIITVETKDDGTTGVAVIAGEKK